jgi:hypothetical protein
MTKRARRYREANIPTEAYSAPSGRPLAAPTANADKPAARQSVASRVLDWQAEYGDVIGDLKRTFIVAIALAAAMFALSFVIR